VAILEQGQRQIRGGDRPHERYLEEKSNSLAIKRKADPQAIHKPGHTTRDDDHKQAIDGWIPNLQAQYKGKNKKFPLRKKRIEANVNSENSRKRSLSEVEEDAVNDAEDDAQEPEATGLGGRNSSMPMR
jgi:hypothetical protein